MSKNVSCIKISPRNEKEAKRLYQKLSFYNKFIEKPKIIGLKDIDLLQEFPVYDELNIIQMSKARTDNVEIIGSKDPLEQWEANKFSIKDLLKDLLDKTKIFKYQIALKVLLRKHKQNRDLRFAPVYFNSTTKTKRVRWTTSTFFLKILFEDLNKTNQNTHVNSLFCK